MKHSRVSLHNHKMQHRDNFTTYDEYLKTLHWQKLREQLIYANPRVKCWICEKTYNLLLHHVKYNNLGKEKRVFTFLFFVFGDVVIVCFDCHSKIHFIKYLFFFRHKVPLKKFYLVKRMKYLRAVYLLKNYRFIPALLAICAYMF